MSPRCHQPFPAETVVVGISACLLGEAVRYDGGHKRAPYLLQSWGRLILWLPVCPEAESGLGVPREPMQLRGTPTAPRLVGLESGRDLADRLRAWSGARLTGLADSGLGGFVFKSRSPSCGLSSATIFSDSGRPRPRPGAGLFASAFARRFPLLPATEEENLRSRQGRQEFLAWLLTMMRWRDLWARGAATELPGLHSNLAPLLRRRAPEAARQLTILAGRCRRQPHPALLLAYRDILCRTLAQR